MKMVSESRENHKRLHGDQTVSGTESIPWCDKLLDFLPPLAQSWTTFGWLIFFSETKWQLYCNHWRFRSLPSREQRKLPLTTPSGFSIGTTLIISVRRSWAALGSSLNINAKNPWNNTMRQRNQLGRNPSNHAWPMKHLFHRDAHATWGQHRVATRVGTEAGPPSTWRWWSRDRTHGPRQCCTTCCESTRICYWAADRSWLSSLASKSMNTDSDTQENIRHRRAQRWSRTCPCNKNRVFHLV